jgi:predicted DNA binding CopG/RHH family protein
MSNAEHEHQTTRTRIKSRIPTFKTVEEEAAFWDTHDLTEFEDELEVVTDVKFVKAKPKRALTVRLEEETMNALTKEAHEKGIGPSTLARMVILEHLKRQHQTADRVKP